jgi:hypothetical protein
MMNDPHHATWERLLVNLTEAQSSFQQYIALLAQEERTLHTMDRQGLAEVNNQKEQVLDAMCRLEQQVEQDIHLLSGSDVQESIWRWLKKTRHPRAQMAQGMLSDLLHLARTIQEQGKKNEALIHRIQHKIQEGIHFLYTGLGTGPVYQGRGTLNLPSLPGSVHLQG